MSIIYLFINYKQVLETFAVEDSHRLSVCGPSLCQFEERNHLTKQPT